jgi:hypothetical protein
MLPEDEMHTEENIPPPKGAARARMLDRDVKFQTCREKEEAGIELASPASAKKNFTSSNWNVHECYPPVWNAKQRRECPVRVDDI